MGIGWLPSWGPAPEPEEEPEDSGPPGYTFPPYIARPATKILNGCPRCQGAVTFRARDMAKYCERCDRAFYPCSDDSIIRYVPPDKAT